LGTLSLSGFLEIRSPFEGNLVDVEVISAAGDYRPLVVLRGAALTDALAFFRRITESCVNGTIIVRIMKWWNFPSCMRILGNSCFCGKSVCLMRSNSVNGRSRGSELDSGRCR